MSRWWVFLCGASPWNLCPAVKCWAAKPHGCMVPCSCLAPSHAQAGQNLARDGHPWEGLNGSWFGKGVSQLGHDHPGWGSGMGRDLALVLGLSELHPKLLLDEPSKSKVLSLFYMVIPHLPTQDCTLLLQQIQGWSSQMFPPPAKYVQVHLAAKSCWHYLCPDDQSPCKTTALDKAARKISLLKTYLF